MQSVLDDILAKLEPEHARALEWFVEHEDEIGARPWRVGGQSVVPGVSIPIVAQRGIHQPSGWKVALSITATRTSIYLDGKPERVDRETWVLPYKAHEGGDGMGLESRWNQALFRNHRERIPVGVFVPEGGQYRNLGLAMVESFDPGTATFLLRGAVRYTQAAGTWTLPEDSSDIVGSLLIAEEAEDLRILAQVRCRVSQDKFRDALMKAYGGRCAATGYDAADALQGAHILAYSGRSSQLTENGLLLRADIHLLFDRHLLSVHPEHRVIRLGSRLRSTAYAGLEGRSLDRPEKDSDVPAANRLAVHWAVFERAAG